MTVWMVVETMEVETMVNDPQGRILMAMTKVAMAESLGVSPQELIWRGIGIHEGELAAPVGGYCCGTQPTGPNQAGHDWQEHSCE